MKHSTKNEKTVLFQPYTFSNGVMARNRLVLAPMTLWSSSKEGEIQPDELAFLQSRSQGAGLVITAATLISKEGKAFSGQPEISERHLSGLRQLARTIRSQGAKAILQLHHGGERAEAELVGAENILRINALSQAEIERLIQAFAHSATLAVQAGFDGVEIMGANGFLIQQFVSRKTNQRTDVWGESTAFALAVVKAVQSAVENSPDFLIGYRFSPEEAGENGLTMAETLTLVEKLAAQKLHYLHVSLWDFYKLARRGADENRTRIEQIHTQIGGRLPLIGVGNLTDTTAIYQAMESGWAEFIAVGKGALLNPDWAMKVQQQQAFKQFLDPNRADRYGMPEGLWQKCLVGASYLPPLKGERVDKAKDLY